MNNIPWLQVVSSESKHAVGVACQNAPWTRSGKAVTQEAWEDVSRGAWFPVWNASRDSGEDFVLPTVEALCRVASSAHERSTADTKGLYPRRAAAPQQDLP